jgi:transcriptional regulator with XRE-family HTH domain
MAGTSQSAFAEWLDVTLSNNKIQGKELAAAIRVHDSAVSRWRSGHSAPSLDAVRRIAQYLKVDPLRLTVTAGFMTEAEARVPPLPIPEAEAQRERVRKQLLSIKGLSIDSRQKLIETYEDIISST